MLCAFSALNGELNYGNANGNLRPFVDRLNQNGAQQFKSSAAADRRNIPIDLFSEGMTRQLNDAHEYEALGSGDELRRKDGDGKFNVSNDNRK